jgi:HAD superfamily phosphatase
MEDAPGKPDPTGLVHIVQHLEATVAQTLPVLYVGDTVADMQTVQNAHQQHPGHSWIGVGVLPPHVQTSAAYAEQYADKLTAAGAAIVLPNVQGLTPDCIQALL